MTAAVFQVLAGFVIGAASGVVVWLSGFVVSS